jgi:flagellar M-ring protein FliF
MNQLAQLGNQIKELWQNLDKKIKWLAIILSASIFVTLVAISIWGNTKEFLPLFYDLALVDAGQIMAALEEEKIPYQLKDGGRTILVPSDKVDSLRIKLSASGLLTGGVVGNELFDQTKWGITDFEQQQMFKRALEGELVRSIRTLSGVKDARVHVVLPESSPFLTDTGTATASVVLTLEPYARISTDQIKSIANFLAGAVPGLSPQNVTIMDSSWNVLSDPSMFNTQFGQSTAPSNQLELKRQIDRELAVNLQSMLERIFGFGNAIVRVSAEVAFDYKETTAERYEPVTGNRGIVRSEQQSREVQSGTSSSVPIGVAGITSNIPGYTFDTNTQDSSSYERSDTITNYEISKVLEYHVVAPGSIKRLSVAVWLHGDLDESTKEMVRQAVIAASGLDFGRGDQLTVESMPFFTAETVTEAPLVAAGPELPYIYIVPVAVVLLLVLLFALRGRTRRQREAAVLEETAAVTEAEEEQESVPAPRLTLERELKLVARQKPEEVAKVLQSWLAED